MSDRLNTYLTRVKNLLNYDDVDESDIPADKQLASCFAIRDKHADQLSRSLTSDVPRSIVRRFLPDPFDSLIILHLRVLYCVSEEKFEEAFRLQSQIVQTFAKEVLQKRKEENWFLAICYQICSDLRTIAKAADKWPTEIETRQSETSYYEKAATPIMECYRNCVGDIRTSVEVSKRLAILNLTNQLFRIYFKINKMNLLKPLVRAVENCGPLYENFSLADKVTYKYFTGCKAMFDSNFKEAEECLSYAFTNSHPNVVKNKRLILMYLIPVKMFLGHMPTSSLLEKYDLMQFDDVAKAVRQGNLMLLEQTLNQNEPFFISCGIFLLLEKLKIVAYRTLFKKICNILGSHQIPLDAFVEALKFLNIDDVDKAEVACIVANLIYQGKIKGYISHQHQKLVISKANAFPPLSSV